jgi:molybdopterin synthase sulfur carrier subunit
MPVVWIPSLLRSLTNGQDKLVVPGATVGQVIDELESLFPGIKSRLCQGDGLRPGIAVAVDAQVARLGLRECVAENSEVHFLPAVGGGQ